MENIRQHRPTDDQKLLLKALFSDGETAVEVWDAWRERVSFEHLDAGSQRLVPLLLNKLQRLNIEHSDLRKYRSVARYVWFKNQLLLRAAQKVLGVFAEAHIPAILLKGLPVTLLYYGDHCLRPMSDLDILVPLPFAYDAARHLHSAGWRSSELSQLKSQGYMRTRNAMMFVDSSQVEIDLHWHIVPECCRPNADEKFWQRSQPLLINGIPTSTLSDTDHFLHACIHGGAPGEASSIRWIADCWQILRTRKVDWSIVLATGHELNLVRRMQRTLSFLRDKFSFPIPASVISKLLATPPSRIELIEEAAGFSRLHPFMKAAVWRYAHYRRNAATHQGLLRYLQDAYGTPSMPATIGSVAQRAAVGLLRLNR